MLNLSSQEFLTKEQIREKADSIFAAKGSSTTSEKYSHIPTHKVIEDYIIALEDAYPKKIILSNFSDQITIQL